MLLQHALQLPTADKPMRARACPKAVLSTTHHVPVPTSQHQPLRRHYTWQVLREEGRPGGRLARRVDVEYREGQPCIGELDRQQAPASRRRSLRRCVYWGSGFD